MLALALIAAAQMQATWGAETIRRLGQDPGNIVLPIHGCELDGFLDDRQPYRAPSVRRSAPGGRIIATAPSAGTYYAGFVIYDTAGDERVRIAIDGAERGVAVANADDNRQRLFYLAEPHVFRGGEKIELRALTDTGIYRIEDIYLLKEKPPPRRFDYVFTHLDASPQGALTWVTSWPAACAVEYGPQGGGALRLVKETTAFENHRLQLSGLRPRAGYRYRVSAVTREGIPVASEWKTFRTGPAPAPAGAARRERIPLRLVNPLEAPGSWASGPHPVTAGVPFPKGALGSSANLRLAAPSGREMALQAETLARWEDGTVKWALADFQADPRTPGAYTLEYGRQVKRRSFPSPLRVRRTDDTLAVTTGPLAFTLSGRRLGLIESLWLEGRALLSPEKPAHFELAGPDGTLYTTLARPAELAIEEEGPQRVVIRASGSHESKDGRRLFAYTIRIHAYAGKPFLRVEYTFGNDYSEEEFASIRSLILRLPLAGVFEGPVPAALRQHRDEPRPAGFAEWSGGGARVTLALRDFWQNYPKDLAAGPGGIELGLCPPLGRDEYAAFKGTADEYKLYYYLLEGRYKFRQGVSKTHDVWLEFQATGGAPSVIRHQRSPLRAVAAPEWYAATKVFGELAVPAPAGLAARYDRLVAAGFDEYQAGREADRAYGMLNFGDWYGERVINWGNGEYDTQKALLIQFLRSGDPRYFRAGEEMEWHNRDVDTIHHHRDPSRIGGVYHHAIGHTGGYYAKTPVPGQGIAPGILTVDHVYCEGHLAYHFLTGDRRSLETARKIAERYGTWETRNYDFFDARVAGWHLLLTTAVYRATLDPLYLNAARIIIRRVLERQTPNGGWDRWPICMHTDPPLHSGELTYMLGVLLGGMVRYHEVTGDPQVAASIAGGARYLAREAWVPEQKGFRYAICPRAVPAEGLETLNFLILDGIAFAHRQTGDPELRVILQQAGEKAIDGLLRIGERRGGRALGKMFGMFASPAPHLLVYLAR